MKNIYGLLIALGLGAAAFMLNWVYLNRAEREREYIHFVGLKSNVDRLEAGDQLLMEHLEPVPIPRNHVGNLENTAFKWEAVETLVRTRINQELIGGHLVLRNYVETPASEGRPLAADEYTLPVPVDSRTFVSRWYKAGDRVWFAVPKLPPAAGGNGPASGGGTDGAVAGDTEIVGGDTGFVVWAVGDRVSSARVAQGARQTGSHQNVLHVVVKMRNGGFIDPKDQRLADLVAGERQPKIIVLAQQPADR